MTPSSRLSDLLPALGGRTLVMGILNVTPDSFSDGGLFAGEAEAVTQAERLVAEGAAILDVGGESTRPGHVPVPAEEEQARVVPVIRAVAPRLPVPISIDTYKASTARVALEAGARIVNDVGGLQREPDIATVAAAHGAGPIPECEGIADVVVVEGGRHVSERLAAIDHRLLGGLRRSPAGLAGEVLAHRLHVRREHLDAVALGDALEAADGALRDADALDAPPNRILPVTIALALVGRDRRLEHDQVRPGVREEAEIPDLLAHGTAHDVVVLGGLLQPPEVRARLRPRRTEGEARTRRDVEGGDQHGDLSGSRRGRGRGERRCGAEPAAGARPPAARRPSPCRAPGRPAAARRWRA